jgi:rhodanese-related sulfurtransferase
MRHAKPILARRAALLALSLLLFPLAACRQEASKPATDDSAAVMEAPEADAPGVDAPAEAVDEASGDRPNGLALVSGSRTEVTADTAAEALASGEAILIDVREQAEWDAGRIPGSRLIPMSQIQDRAGEVPMDQPVILYCRSGNRSGQVQQFLQERGYTQVYSMQGGIQAWEAEDRPVEQ